MSKQLPFGAALQFAIATLGGPLFEQEKSLTVSNISPGTVVVDNNGDRVGLIFVNMGATDCLLTLGTDTTGTLGIRIVASGGIAALNVRDDFTLCARRWIGTAVSAPATVYVLEFIRYNKTESM